MSASERLLEQFDQITTQRGLWDWDKWGEVRCNIEDGVIEPEREVVHDTTHYEAHSSFEVVEYEDEKGQKQNKSQPKMSKGCACPDKTACRHRWGLADDGAGAVVKSLTKMYWAHKGSVLALPGQEVPPDAVAVQDAATHDGQTLMPHLRRLFEHLPQTRAWFHYVLDDGAAYDAALRQEIHEEFHLILRASVNPRRQPEITESWPHGVQRVTPYGRVYCRAGHAFDFLGTRPGSRHFLYGPPADPTGAPRCQACPWRSECCPRAAKGRHVVIPFGLLPHLSPDDPPMGKRYEKMMKRRPSIERVIKRLKQDLGDDRLTKRGNASFQARLDKTLIALHISLRA